MNKKRLLTMAVAIMLFLSVLAACNSDIGELQEEWIDNEEEWSAPDF